MVDEFDLVTASPGPVPHPRVQHIELIPDQHRPQTRIRALVADFAREHEWFAWNYRQIPIVRAASHRLSGQHFDAVVTNDAESIGVAVSLFGGERVHADLHEFFPGLAVTDDELGRRQQRYWRWLIERHASRVASTTTVAPAIARRYEDFGLSPGVVTNASFYREKEPRPTTGRIRLVHSGNSFRDRGLDGMMTAVARARADLSLDLYLTHNPAADRDDLVELARELGSRITIHEPVPQADLIDVLGEYDIGIGVFPPTCENNSFALPNKFFDFVQARLGVVVGPSPDMAEIVHSHGLGLVTDGFTIEDTVRVLEGLDAAQVDRFKSRSHAAAAELAAESQMSVWLEAIRVLTSGRPRRGRLRTQLGLWRRSFTSLLKKASASSNF